MAQTVLAPQLKPSSTMRADGSAAYVPDVVQELVFRRHLADGHVVVAERLGHLLGRRRTVQPVHQKT